MSTDFGFPSDTYLLRIEWVGCILRSACSVRGHSRGRVGAGAFCNTDIRRRLLAANWPSMPDQWSIASGQEASSSSCALPRTVTYPPQRSRNKSAANDGAKLERARASTDLRDG